MSNVRNQTEVYSADRTEQNQLICRVTDKGAELWRTSCTYIGFNVLDSNHVLALYNSHLFQNASAEFSSSATLVPQVFRNVRQQQIIERACYLFDVSAACACQALRAACIIF